MIFDLTYPDIDYNAFPEYEWTEFYENIQEIIPPNALELRGRPIQLQMYVDSNHAGDKQMRNSQMGMMIFCNTGMIK